MTMLTNWRASWMVAAIASLLPSATLFAQQAGSTRTRILATVDDAIKQKGNFAAARGALERILGDCGNEADVAGCRTLVTYSLGYLHQTEGMGGASARDSALMRAVSLYDAVLRQDPAHAGALYNKALAYRSMGAHEWQEPFFQEAARRDPARRALYLSLLGDYYTDLRRPERASRAYREALVVDPDDAGARSGLIEAERARGAAGGHALLDVAEQWQLTAPGYAVDVYRAALDIALTPPGGAAQDGALADEACVRLVLSQQQLNSEFLVSRAGDTPGAVNDWPPLLEMERFLRSAVADSAPWWLNAPDRRAALAHAALLRGGAEAAYRNLELAERFWSAGVNVGEHGSATVASIQRELALLYTREPGLDPDGSKFTRLENEIFEEKSEALVSRDLEAAQRFHQTLALIYSQRGIWQSESARNAITQLTWALRAADERSREEKFFQPLPEVHELLAVGLDSVGSRSDAAREAEAAVRAYLDVDDIEGATRAAATLARLGGSPALERLKVLIALRSNIACEAASDRRITGTGPADFVRRQRFKVIADCVAAETRAGRARAIAAYDAADTVTFTLVGIADVRRLERVMTRILEPAGIEYRPASIETVPPADGRPLPVSMPSETSARWLKLERDDVIAVAVVRVLGPESRNQVRVRNGDVTVDGINADVVGRLRAIPGVRNVRSEYRSTR